MATAPLEMRTSHAQDDGARRGARRIAQSELDTPVEEYDHA